MKCLALLGIAFAVSYGIGARLAAQAPEQQLDIVEVVGCLAQAADTTWVLTDATDPVVSKTVFTTKEALAEAATRPLGTQRYRLLGTAPFTPELHKGEKMAAKGVLIKDPKESRLNVTSLQTLAATCGK